MSSAGSIIFQGRDAQRLDGYFDKATNTNLTIIQNAANSGENFKTVNGQSILGSGNIEITTQGTIVIDDELSDNSTNTVQNSVVYRALQNKLSKTDADSLYQPVLSANQLASLNADHSKYLTSHQSLSGYATKTYVNNSISTLATKEELMTSKTNIIVDNLCGTLENGYTLSTALEALNKLQNSLNIKCIQYGTIISYTTKEGYMETKQFTGTDDNVTDVSQWSNYGGYRQVTLTQDEYDALVLAGTIDDDTYYNILDE